MPTGRTAGVEDLRIVLLELQELLLLGLVLALGGLELGRQLLALGLGEDVDRDFGMRPGGIVERETYDEEGRRRTRTESSRPF